MTTDTLERKSLADLQVAGLPRMTAKLLGITFKEGVEPDAATLEFVEDVDAYLANFVAPEVDDSKDGTGFLIGKSKCICCGNSLDGLLGSFRWGMAWGEGSCSCGYPVRAIHIIKDRHGKECFSRALQIMMQYHPTVLEGKGKSCKQ